MLSNGKPIPFHYFNTSTPRKMTFSKDSRFMQYRDWEKATGQLVGPGTYSPHIILQKFLQTPCQIKIRKLIGLNRKNIDGYIMEGNHVVYYPHYLMKEDLKAKEKYQAQNLDVDLRASISFFNKPRLNSGTNSPLKNNFLQAKHKDNFWNNPKSEKKKLYGCTFSNTFQSFDKSRGEKSIEVLIKRFHLNEFRNLFKQ